MSADPMLEGARANLDWEIDRIVDCVRSAGDARAARRPAAKDANSISAIAAHALGAAREHVLGWALGQATAADGDAFDDGLTLEMIEERQHQLASDLDRAFAQLATDDLSRLVMTPGRGAQPVRDVLWWAVLHAAEHAGAAELTRDLLLADDARGPSS